MIANNLLHYRKPQARALGFGGSEQLEDIDPMRYSLTRVRHFQDNPSF